MKKLNTLTFLILGLIFFNLQSIRAYSTPSLLLSKINKSFHNETIGIFLFEKYADDLLLLTAKVEKKHFTYALRKEGDCTPKDMIEVCGNQYLIENFTVNINDQKVKLKQESLTLEKDFVILTYSIPLEEKAISSIKITSDYMFKYNDHSILNIIFELNGPSRSFKIKNNRRSITASF